MKNVDYLVDYWNKKRKLAQACLMCAVLLFISIIGVSLYHLLLSESSFSHFPWGKMSAVTILDMVFLFASLSSLSNYAFLYHHFHSQWILEKQPEELDLVTGRVESIERVVFPFAGRFQRIQLRLRSGNLETYYIHTGSTGGVACGGDVRLRVNHMFGVQVFPID